MDPYRASVDFARSQLWSGWRLESEMFDQASGMKEADDTEPSASGPFPIKQRPGTPPPTTLSSYSRGQTKSTKKVNF